MAMQPRLKPSNARAAVARGLLDGYVSPEGEQRDDGVFDPEALRDAVAGSD